MVVDIPSTELFTSLFIYYYDILKIMKNMYIVQPYAVGSKSAKVKSLVFVIPAPVREKARIVASMYTYATTRRKEGSDYR